MRFAHITDLHFPFKSSVKWWEMTPKRILAYLSWIKKRQHQISDDILMDLQADLKAQNLDHIVITGDLLNLSLHSEYARSREWVRELGGGTDITIIPGNHDAHRFNLKTMMSQYWKEYAVGDDALSEGRDISFPFIRRRGDVAIIGVSSAVYTPLFYAGGYVGNRQLNRLRGQLTRLKGDGLYRVVLIHHPPQIGANNHRKALLDAKAFERVIRDAGAELILHGHNHKPLRAEFTGKNHLAYIRGCGAGGANGNNGIGTAHYHICEIKKDETRFVTHIEHRQYQTQTKMFETSEIEILKY